MAMGRKRERGLDEAKSAAQQTDRKASTTVSPSNAEFFISDSSPEEESATTPTQPSTLQQYLPYWVTGYTAPQGWVH